jgi:hypothetical protein
MKTPRVRRSDTPPSEMGEPFPSHLKSIREIDLSADAGFIGRYRKYPRAWLAEAPDRIYQRRIYCWLFADSELVGTFQILDFDLPSERYVSDEEFWELMDDYSNSTMELAEALSATWPDISDTILPYGPVVLIDRAWVKPKSARYSEWAGVLRRLIELEYRNHSVIALKAFPIEREPNDDENRFESRRQGLMRLYRRVLGMRSFPGDLGRDGWMYAIAPRLDGVIEEPIPKSILP